MTIAAVGLLLRVSVRLYTGSVGFWDNGYTFYFDQAQAIAAGHWPTAYRVPIYPMFLAAVTLGHKAFLPLVLAQSLVGALTVVGGGLLATEHFGAKAGLMTAVMAAVYPYYVVHDTAIQETGLFTCLTAFSVLLLVRARRTGSARLAAGAGLLLAADVLTRATIAPFALFAPVWLGWVGIGSARERAGAALLCAGMLVLGLTPWMIRSVVLTGIPSLSTETGFQLWVGNNPHTFSHYPAESIDRSAGEAIDAMSPGEAAALGAFGTDEQAIDRWFLEKAVGFVREHPWHAVGSGLRKVAAAFSCLPSPRRSFWPNVGYALTYGPVMILGLAGMVLSRHCWREHSVIYVLFLSFAMVTVVFFGHTSHRSFLDVYWMGYAASLAMCPGRLPGARGLNSISGRTKTRPSGTTTDRALHSFVDEADVFQ